MITRVYIDNFKCFSNCEVRPERINLLIGDNGAGKTTYLDIVHRVIGLIIGDQPIDEFFPGFTTTAWDTRTSQRIELDVAAEQGQYTYALQVGHDLEKDTAWIHREEVALDSKTLFLFEDGTVHLFNNQGREETKFPFKGNRSFLSQLEPRPENQLLTALIHDILPNLWFLRLDPSAIELVSRAEELSLDVDARNFASWYRHLAQERPEDLSGLFELIRNMLTNFRSLKTVSGGKDGRERLLVARFAYGQQEDYFQIDFDDLSDGERAVIVLSCVLWDSLEAPKILLLDEPENFVGLSSIQPWLVELGDALRDKGQLFLISHHPEVIDYLAADHSLLFERPDGGPTRVRRAVFDRDEGFNASELIKKGLVDGE